MGGAEKPLESATSRHRPLRPIITTGLRSAGSHAFPTKHIGGQTRLRRGHWACVRVPSRNEVKDGLGLACFCESMIYVRLRSSRHGCARLCRMEEIRSPIHLRAQRKFRLESLESLDRGLWYLSPGTISIPSTVPEGCGYPLSYRRSTNHNAELCSMTCAGADPRIFPGSFFFDPPNLTLS